MVDPENYEHERGLLWGSGFFLGFQYVCFMNPRIYQGKNANPTINPGSQLHVHSFQG